MSLSPARAICRRLMILVVACLAGEQALAEARPGMGVSDWSKGMHSAVRLVDGGIVAGRRTAGLEIRLDKHFKTYWRTPGDSGLPPVFDWSGSQNVRAVDVRWPAPMRFDDSAGSSIGFKGEVVLPLTVTPKDPSQPAVLALQLEYAVCEQICIPAKAEARLDLPATPLLLSRASALRQAEARVPPRAEIGAHGTPSLRHVAIEPGGRSLITRIVVPAAARIVDIFTEGPDGWTFGGPVAVAAVEAPGGLREITYRIGVDSRPTAGRLQGLPVTLTVTADDDAIEASTHLDGTAKPH
jgi:DsbC/DsbD-like thiol-disulfide interchange protein